MQEGIAERRLRYIGDYTEAAVDMPSAHLNDEKNPKRVPGSCSPEGFKHWHRPPTYKGHLADSARSVEMHARPCGSCLLVLRSLGVMA